MMFAPDHPGARWAALTQAQRDAAYNNNLAVPDAARWVAERNAASVEYRAAHAGKLDLPYGSKPRQAWDLYPGSSPNAPCLVFIHGGYWQMNGRENFAYLAQGVAAHGWSVAMPGYTLAPDATLKDIVGEIDTALDWLAANGAAHGISGPIIVSGWSAGGHLTAMALGHKAVTAGLAISGIYELGPLRDTYLDQKLSLTDDEIETLSPLRLLVEDKPMTVAYGSREVPALVEDARAFHALRARAHAPGALLPVPGTDHFSILPELVKPEGVLTRAALALAR